MTDISLSQFKMIAEVSSKSKDSTERTLANCLVYVIEELERLRRQSRDSADLIGKLSHELTQTRGKMLGSAPHGH